MTESTSNSLHERAKEVPTTSTSNTNIPTIPIEIGSEEEMAFIEAAFAATRSCLSPSPLPAIRSPSPSSVFQINSRSIRSITSLSKRRFPVASSQSEIEDLGDLRFSQKTESFIQKYRKKSGLFVTDITSTEWCEKQMSFVLKYGKREVTKAMKAGRDRHLKLEEEVVKRVKVSIESTEDIWALKLLNFITGSNQLLFEGLTRELPVVGFAHGVWIVGIIDEIRLPEGENRNPILVDTKTRLRDTLPSEPQRRNGRLQLMCYKYLWDNLVADKFPSRAFFDSFSLNPHYILSKEMRENTAAAGIPAQTLEDVVRYFRNTCRVLLPADKEMLLRYESQADNSVLGEDPFAYDPDWLESQMQNCLEFWWGEREPNFAPEEELWKCNHCQFSSICPANTDKSSPVKSTSNSSSPVKSKSPDSSPRYRRKC